ncbi:XK-related protein 6-like [Branchiostoma lanceolatum]|uniref:XK-related protein 6-like n=1 Tax=Branchiostoma lanceolatum TaxID=7740 RepID=UPI003456C9C0
MCYSVQKRWLVFRTLVAFALYITDFVTDVTLALEYAIYNHYYWFCLTLGFALVPQIIVNMILWKREGCKWYYVLGLGVPAKYIQVLYAFFCRKENTSGDRETEDQENHKSVTRTVNDLLPLARLVGTLLESLPEICLQIYVLLRTGELNSLEIQTFKAFTMAVSFLASLYSIIEWETSFPNVKAWVWGPFLFVWKTIDLPARILALCLFASIYEVRYWVFVMVGLHWLVMVGVENYFSLCLNKGKDSKRCKRFMFNTFLYSPMNVFTWVTFGSRERRMGQSIVNGLLTLVANILMVLVWYSVYKEGNWAWYGTPVEVLGLLIGGSVASFLLQIIYCVCYQRCCPCSHMGRV